MSLIEHRPLVDVSLPWLENPCNMRCFSFYSHRESSPGCQFSNLYPVPVTIDTNLLLPGTQEHFLVEPRGIVTFPSSENAFQCAKACEPLFVDFVLALDPLNAARAGQGRLKMNKSQRTLYEELGGVVCVSGTGKKKKHLISQDARYKRRPDWEQLKREVMSLALEAKFSQHPALWGDEVRENPQGIYLIEHTSNDGQWGDRGDGTGTNFLGKMLTTLCWETHTGKSIDRQSEAYSLWLSTPNQEIAPGLYAEEKI